MSVRALDMAPMWCWTWVFLVSSARLVAPSRGETCSLFRNIKKATFHGQKDTYTPGETVSYSCNHGFRLKGNSNVLLCEKNGNWKPKSAKCEQIKCETFTIANGDVKIGHRRFNTKVNITCKDGYQLRGPSVVTCGADGSWTPALPSCEEGKCPPLPHFPNAHTEHGNQTHYEPNTAVRYKCNHGYRMARGPSTIHCRSGRWTELEMICERKPCGSAGEIENGRFHYTGSLFGDTATAMCNEGYHLVGTDVRHCTANGWDGRVPVCEAIQCPEPPLVPDADVDFESSGIIKYGHMASYRCHFGKLIGASEIVCTKDGTWSHEAPRCEVVTCAAPNVWSGLIVSGMRTRYLPGSSVTFRCNPGGRLLGPAVITCGSDGHWNPRLPRCVFWPSSRTAICRSSKKMKNVTFHGTKATYEPGETLSYSCNAGFHLSGDNNVVQCDGTGKWNPSNVNRRTKEIGPKKE